MSADPCRVADVTLAAAVRTSADAVYIEPESGSDGGYLITLERQGEALVSVPLEGPIGEAVIVRLAYLADIDLAASHATSAVLPVRSGARDADVVITVRPGASLRADLMVMAKAKPRSGPIETVEPR